MMLLSGNIDNDTVAAFMLKKNFDDILISYTDVSKVMNETKLIYTAILISQISSYQLQENIGIIEDAVNLSFIIQSNEAAVSGNILIKSK